MTAAVLDELDLIHNALQKDLRKVTSYTQQDLKFVFHPHCFVCTECGTSMEGRSFYNHQNNHLCTDCYHEKVLGKCDLCGAVFKDPTVVKAAGKQFHQQCFTCSTCKKELTSTFIEKDDQFMCKVSVF
ncbi:Four and a half LIM domains protein 2 [Boothiomyces macroporosus]|uniref:Four and a half LIM domains protein 2 n=1 Tax=Boothiomyces macroporosus TaxID=261099 RepID=A0AAD5UM37_9FUNG|nr:Four and a half LIM domains protein 2 [Boothiomyces macroporosus]